MKFLKRSDNMLHIMRAFEIGCCVLSIYKVNYYGAYFKKTIA